MMNKVSVDTDYGIITATWRREGNYIVVRWGDRMKKAQASDQDATNDFVATDILRGWIADDLSQPE